MGVAKDIGTLGRRYNLVPVSFERIGVQDMGRLMDRDACIVLSKLNGETVVHDMVHHPQSNFRDARRKLAQLNAIELININL